MRCAACVCAYQPRVIRYVDPTNELYADRKEEEQEEEVEVDEDVFSIGGVEDVVEEEEEMKSVVVSRKRAREEEEGEMSVGEDPAPNAHVRRRRRRRKHLSGPIRCVCLSRVFVRSYVLRMMWRFEFPRPRMRCVCAWRSCVRTRIRVWWTTRC